MIFIRILSILLILSFAAYAPLAVFVIVAVCYTLYFTAYEIIVLGLLIDVLYGGGTNVPYYTLLGTMLFVACEWIKPRLLMYNR